MRSDQRKQHILKTAQENGFVSIPKTAQLLGVSVETIRRDVDALCQKNQLKKVYGGATPIKSPRHTDASFRVRLKQNQHVKLAIVREAIKLIPDNSIVALDCGATTEFMASHIRDVHNVTFFVNSLRVGTILSDKETAGDFDGGVIMTGGQIVCSTYRSYTILALETVDRYHFDITFVSATGLTASGASSTATNPAVFSKRLLERSSTRVLVIESYKLGMHALMDFAKPTDFDYIITDDQNPFPADILEVLQKSNTELIIVSCDGEA